MNFSQKLGLFILIVISAVYVYSSFFGDKFFSNFKIPEFFKKSEQNVQYNPLDVPEENAAEVTEENKTKKVKIFVLDKNGILRSVSRTCDTEKNNSCFEFAVRELINAPTKWEKSKGFTSEIPYGTRVLSVRESSNSIFIDLTSDFETGGGAESTYMRIKQLIKTANANTSLPVYLYLNGKQVNVIGGEGVMIKQPLNDKSLDG